MNKTSEDKVEIIKEICAVETDQHPRLVHLEIMTNLFRAYLVMTPMGELISFKPNDKCQIAFYKLDSENIDYAPILKNGIPVGYVGKNDLASSKRKVCRQFLRPITVKNRVSLESSLETVLKRLITEPFLFVIENNDLQGIISRADINKRGFRTLFYILLSELESLLVNLIRNRLPCNKNLQLLSDDRAKDVLYNFWKAKAANVETSIEQYLSFSDIINMISKSNDIVSWLWLGFKSKQELKSLVPLMDLRNYVMHSTRSLLKNEEAVASIHQRYMQLWELIENLWEIESLDQTDILSVDFSRKNQDYKFTLKSGAVIRTSLDFVAGKELEELGTEKLRRFLSSDNLKKRSNESAIGQLTTIVLAKLLQR